jgi:hypothetical protein
MQYWTSAHQICGRCPALFLSIGIGGEERGDYDCTETDKLQDFHGKLCGGAQESNRLLIVSFCEL